MANFNEVERAAGNFLVPTIENYKHHDLVPFKLEEGRKFQTNANPCFI